MGGLTDDEMALKQSAYLQLNQMINQQSRKIEQHSDKFMRFVKEGNQKITDKLQQDKNEKNAAMFVFDEEDKRKKDPYKRVNKQQVDQSSDNAFAFGQQQ